MDAITQAAIDAAIGAVGFDDRGRCAASALVVDPRVREMCAVNRCNAYGRNWSCPPACGPLEDFRALIGGYESCVIVQTVRPLEDEYDVKTMIEADKIHKGRMADLAARLAELGIPCTVLSSGACTRCKPCAYPDAPCRFPDRRLVSMEAAGLNVTETCKAAAVPYNHGPHTIAYTGCVLL